MRNRQYIITEKFANEIAMAQKVLFHVGVDAASRALRGGNRHEISWEDSVRNKMQEAGDILTRVIDSLELKED